jgi:signal transduction histidine kinase
MKFVALPMKYLSLFFIGFFSLPGVPKLAAQEKPPVIDISKILLSDTIYNRCFYFEDSLHTVTPDQLPSLLFREKISKGIFKQLSAKQVEKDWYLQFCLQNTADSSVTVDFYPGIYLTRIDLFVYNDSTKKIQPIPVLFPDVQDSAGYRKLILSPHSKSTYYAGLKFVKTNVNGMDVRIIKDYFLPVFDKNNKIPLSNNNMYTYIITGILLMMIFYSMAVFILNGSVEFMYYACFAFFMGLLFFLNSFYYKTPVSFNYNFQSYLDFVIQSTGVFFYFIFLRKFLETKKNFPLLNKLFVAGQIIIMISLSLFSWFNFLTDDYAKQEMVETITKYQWFLTMIVFIVYAIIHNNKMLNYLAVGHFFLLAASVLSQVLIQYPAILHIPIPSIWRDALFYYELGMTIELIFFLMALAFKNRRDLIERTRERERLKLDNERKEFEKQLAIVEAKQEERDRISTDMHDELGSGVTAIRLMSEIVKTKMKGNTLPEIDKISNNANDLLGKMNTIIWTMSSSNDKLDNMIAYIRSYAFEFFESTNINCHFETAENIPSTEMSGEKRRNIFLCIKESLNNAAKHSRANDVWIKITILQGKLEIEIHDNGVGINLEKLREFGNGLNNMRKRMQGVEGSFTIMNKEGTTTLFTVPL